jgi:hypothetical protein
MKLQTAAPIRKSKKGKKEMAFTESKTLTAFLGQGVSATFTNRISAPAHGYYLDIIWANGESGLDYGIEIDATAAASLIEALKIVIAESEQN